MNKVYGICFALIAWSAAHGYALTEHIDSRCLADAHAGYIDFNYQYSTPFKFRTVKIALSDGEQSASFTILMHSGSGSFQIYESRLSFAPTHVTVVDNDMWFTFTTIQCRIIDAPIIDNRQDAFHKIDATTLLERDLPRTADNPEYWIYEWHYYPNILIIDTKDYHVLARFFNRLAFFLEKNNHVGTIYTERELSNRFAWNGHNYNGEGLASFYNAAVAQNISLNEYETMVQTIALQRGMITYQNGIYRNGSDGGILGISQQSAPITRKIILYHELLHGIFYSATHFRDAVFSHWNSLSADQQRAWMHVLTALTYDARNEYLVANELQAYLLAKEPQESLQQIFSVARNVATADAQLQPTMRALSVESLQSSITALSHMLTVYTGFAPGNMETIIGE